MKKKLTLILAIMLSSLLSDAHMSVITFENSISFFIKDKQINDLVKNAASQKVESFLALIPEGREKDYGFKNRSDFSRVKIEEPYQVFYLLKKDDKLIFNSGNEWRVPLSVDGHFVALLTVQVTDGVAEAVDFGANVLAQKIEEFETLYSKGNNERVLIRNTFLKRDYMTTTFSSLCGQKTDNGFEINTKEVMPIYHINAGRPAPSDFSIFYKESLESSININ